MTTGGRWLQCCRGEAVIARTYVPLIAAIGRETLFVYFL